MRIENASNLAITDISMSKLSARIYVAKCGTITTLILKIEDGTM